MPGSSLLALLDDITSLLDDVGTLTKVATQKTAGVIGDDLAVNAEQMDGIRADRELPVVWAVAKGSALNKLIIVPAALLLSEFIPWIITPLLMLGGAFLCFEGFEKVIHKVVPTRDDRRQRIVQEVSKTDGDLLSLEADRVKGAIRTDLILSSEIAVIALGTVQDQPFWPRTLTMISIATLMTIGVYAFVAAIVKMDDVGLALMRSSPGGGVRRSLGSAIAWTAPRLLQVLTFLGTIAMFLVGGGILVHGLPFLGQLVHGVETSASHLPSIGPYLGAIAPSLLTFGIGLLVGGLILPVVMFVQKLRNKSAPAT